MTWNITKPLNVRHKGNSTVRERAFIFANYKTMSARQMAKKLNRSVCFVTGFMRKYNLPFYFQRTKKDEKA